MCDSNNNPEMPGAGETGGGHGPSGAQTQNAGDARRLAWAARMDEALSRLLFPRHAADPELARRARLITRFGLLGFVFGMAYATFYFIVGHFWGTGIIVICSVAFGLVPFLIRPFQSLDVPGNLLAGIMVAGFTGLCCVENGMHGHAIAWLASVPLCALLLVGRRAAYAWAGAAFAACAGVVGAGLAGVKFPSTYDLAWDPLITAAGYLGLIAFMFLLGVIFETSRKRAFRKMKEALAKLEASNEQLVHLNNEKNEFLGIAAHDLKNPLTAIMGSAELITMIPDPAKTTKLAENIFSAGKRMRDLISNLLDANAIEQGRFTSNIERCDFSALVRQSVENNQPNAARKDIPLRPAIPDGLWARADRAAVLQILDNLISNAVKYSPPGSTVEITARLDGGQVVAAVKDQGPGLSEEDQKKLFRKFTRLSARPTGGESSTGLGLSIVKRLAEAMSGSVGCQSAPGAGSTFSVRLPADDCASGLREAA